MAEQVVRLIYPSTLLKTPILNTLIRRYKDLVINILRAQVSEAEGWLEVQFIGSAPMIEVAILWLKEQNIEVQILSA